MMMRRFWLTLLVAFAQSNLVHAALLWPSQSVDPWPEEYGVDVSTPIHHGIDASRYPGYAKRYKALMAGCYAKFSKHECDSCEESRMDMNREQPAKHHNYTTMGFKKTRVPEAAWQPLIQFYKDNRGNEKIESWPRGNTYVNNWDSPSYMISFEDRSLRGGYTMKDQIWDAVKPVIEEWTGHTMQRSSLYGIRLYKDGAVLATHVDRMPLVSSAIIQVDQDVDEPWPIEVYDHKGRAHNITMLPGDMVLYESHTILHGRPFPLKGRFYANVFVHFIPVDHDEMNRLESLDPSELKAIKRDIGERHASDVGGHEQSNHAEREEDELRRKFLLTREEMQQRLELAREREEQEEEPEYEEEEAAPVEREEEDEEEELSEEILDFWNKCLEAATAGDLDKVKSCVQENRILLQLHDKNDWTILHEVIRDGQTEIVKYLVEAGADIEEEVSEGGNALWVAHQNLPEGHETRVFMDNLFDRLRDEMAQSSETEA